MWLLFISILTVFVLSKLKRSRCGVWSLIFSFDYCCRQRSLCCQHVYGKKNRPRVWKFFSVVCLRCYSPTKKLEKPSHNQDWSHDLWCPPPGNLWLPSMLLMDMVVMRDAPNRALTTKFKCVLYTNFHVFCPLQQLFFHKKLLKNHHVVIRPLNY
jgi:hypothetical protein